MLKCRRAWYANISRTLLRQNNCECDNSQLKTRWGCDIQQAWPTKSVKSTYLPSYCVSVTHWLSVSEYVWYLLDLQEMKWPEQHKASSYYFGHSRNSYMAEIHINTHSNGLHAHHIHTLDSDDDILQSSIYSDSTHLDQMRPVTWLSLLFQNNQPTRESSSMDKIVIALITGDVTIKTGDVKIGHVLILIG